MSKDKNEEVNINEIPALTSYKMAFNLVKVFAIVIVIISVSASSISYYLGVKEVADFKEKIWVLDSEGMAYPAAMVNESIENKKIEYISNMELFLRLWFEFDEGNYQKHIEKGLFLLGDCGKLMLEGYNSQRMEDKLQQFNLHFTVNVKEVNVDMGVVPAKVKLVFEQRITRGVTSKLRTIKAECFLLDKGIGRSLDNPHGLKIEDWKMETLEVKEEL